MQTTRSVALVASAAALATAGAVAAAIAVGGHHEPAPLPPIATTVSTATSAGTKLPFHLTSPPSCPAFGLDSPVATHDGRAEVILLKGDSPAMVSIVCPAAASFGGLDGLIDHLRRYRQDSFLVGEPVVERGPLGDAVRTQEHLSGTLVTEWRVERDGTIVTFGYMRDVGDESRTAEVEAMLASWTWG